MGWADTELIVGLTFLLTWVVCVALATVSGDRPQWSSSPVLLATGVAAGLFTAQAGVVDAVADPAPVAVTDGLALQWLVAHRSGPSTATAELASTLGSTAAMTVVAAVGAALLWWQGNRRPALVVVVAAGGAAVLVETFKHLYARPRPPVATRLIPEDNYSLPSGHALGSIVVLGVLGAAVILLARSPGLRWAAGIGVPAAVVVIGGSRLYLGVHWLSDVLDGWLLGGAWLTLCIGALRAVARPAPVACGEATRAQLRG